MSSPDIPTWIFPAWFVLVATLLVGRMWYGARMFKAQGRSIRPKLPPDALFGESGASGNSMKSWITRSGGASRVLLVWVSEREFVVEAVFPFNIFMYANPFDLEHRVPLGAINNVKLEGRNTIYVSFDDADMQPHTLRLILKRPEQLLSVLDSLRPGLKAVANP